MKKLWMASACIGAGLGALALAGCSGGSTSVGSTVTVQGDVPIAYAMRVNTIGANPTNGAPTAPGGDIFIRETSSASAIEHNITAQFTQGQGDASGPEASYDGTKIVFSMRCPTSNTSTIGNVPACTGRWNIWEYDMSTGGITGGTFRRITSATDSDDVDATYLPAGGGFVFTSNRQTESSVNQALGHSYYALDEYERERVFNLHTMNAQGSAITQISFNQSHDRSPVVRPDGDVMFARWDHLGGRNHFKIFTVKPDGTNLFVLYGPHSDGVAFLHPRDMDPNGKYAGSLSSDLMPLSRTSEGGALMLIDVADYSDQNTPASPSIPASGGQQQMTAQTLNINGGASQYGRITTPYPLWDGTDRVLVSYTPCEVSNQGVVVSCATLTAAEMARMSDDNRLVADVLADPLQDNVPPSYAVYMFDPTQQTFLIVAAPPAGFMYTHPVALLARAEPNPSDTTAVDSTLASQGLGVLDIRSVYDTDGLGRMSDPVIAAADLPAGCTTAIAKTTPTDTNDTRALVADIVRIKNPADPAYGCTPVRFVRAVRAVAPPLGTTGERNAIGETEFEMQQVLGYAPIEPDGSFKLTVPADTPIALAVIDTQGRAFQTHTNWIQVRPGELRTCDGCHSPRRGGSLNSGAIVNTMPAALLPAMASAHLSGETMAETRTRLDPTALQLTADLIYSDIWADTSQSGVTGHAPITIRYTGNANPADDLVTAVPVNGIINYPDHIQPLWTRDRGANTCVTCHTNPDLLDLTATIAGSGRIESYDNLMIGQPLLDPTTGLPQTEIDEGVLVIAQAPALVDTAASESVALGLARKSRLAEIMWGQTLMSSSAAQAANPNPPASAPDHSLMLNAAEKRLISEWIDTGGKYYNDPFNAANGIRQVTGLDETSFIAQVYPILMTTCAAGCHQAIGSTDNGVPMGTSFRNNRFVLTGDPDGDYNVTLTMISNACNAPSNYLLSKPSTVPHPVGAIGDVTAVLPPGSANYNAIATWIAGGC
jgi:hypothetical protein